LRTSDFTFSISRLRLIYPRETVLHRPGRQRRDARGDAGETWHRATQAFVDPAAPDDGDLSRPAQVFVPEADYDRAHQLFYAEREDEL